MTEVSRLFLCSLFFLFKYLETCRRRENLYESEVKNAYMKVAKETMSECVGLAVCVQIVGNSYEDEKVLRAMRVVQ